MRTSVRLLTGILCSAFTLHSAFSLPDRKAGDGHPVVILVTLDGFPARALKDPRLPMPTLLSLAKSGAVAEGMIPVNPTVTWPNHTALITGVDASVHQVMANGLIEFPADGGAPQVEPWVDKERLVHAPTLYEAADKAGLTTGQVDWVAIYGTRHVRWQFGEVPDANGEIAKDLIAEGLATRDQLEEFDRQSSPAWRDQIWTDAAVDIIRKHQPDLLLVHLLATDSIQHAYGPLTGAAYSAYAYADDCLARIVNAVREAGMQDRTTFIVASDHGFAPYTHTIYPNVALAEQGLLQKQGSKYTGMVWAKAEGGAASLYIRDVKQRASLMPKLQAYFAAVPGVAHVYTNEESRALGLPSDGKSDQAPQLYLVAAPGYAFGDDASGSLLRDHGVEGQHGYINSMPEMQALFVASGAAIVPGKHLGVISNLQVAPTIAKILGLRLEDAKREPLAQILKR